MAAIEMLGLMAAAVTLSMFIPQIFKGYRTKKLDDVSYFLMILGIAGMFLWALYGFLRDDIVIITANIVGMALNAILLLLKKHYSK